MARRRLSGFIQSTLKRARDTLRPSWSPAGGSGPVLDRCMRVLVIDDEPKVGRAIKRLLHRHDVTLVHDGESALRAIRAEVYDVVISDIMMPPMSGMDVYDTLRGEGSPLVERFIFVTGGGHSDSARAFLEAVPNQRFDKPVEFATLEQAIARVCPPAASLDPAIDARQA